MFTSQMLLATPAIGGSGGWTPADVTTERWYDFSDASTVTLSGSDMTQADDKSGNSRHLTGTSGKLPEYDGVNSALILSSTVQATMATFSEDVDVFAVATRTNTDSYSVVGGSGGGITAIPLVIPGTTGAPTNIVRINGVNTDEDTFVDGVQQFTRSELATSMGSAKFTLSVLNITSSAPSTLTIGENTSATWASLVGSLHELIFIPAGTVDRATVEAYFQNKWSL